MTWETARSAAAFDGLPPTWAVAPDGRPYLTPAGVRTCRIIQTVLGTASLWVLFLIGRNRFGAGAALTAVLLLSTTPWHLRQSVAFKPDIMLVLTGVIALWAMLAAVRNGSVRSYAVAGAMVGATVASKWNGGALLLPLAVAIALGGLRDVPLLLRRAAAAGASAAGVLLALNPWLVLDPDLYRRHLGSTVTQYQERVVNAGSGWFDQPLSVITSLAGSVYFSPVLGICALLGLTVLLAHVVRHRSVRGPLPGVGSGLTAADATLLLTFLGGYVAALWAATRYPKPPNWLIVAPIAALAGGWLISRLLAITRRLPTGWRRAATPAFVVLIAAALSAKVHFAHRMAYDENVPLTTDQAARTAGQDKPLRGRTVVTELPLRAQAFDPRLWDSAYVPTVVRTEDIAEEDAAEATRADALLFPASRLEPEADLPHGKLAAAAGATLTLFEPGPFRLRGEPIALVRRTFQRLAPPEPAAFRALEQGAWLVDLPTPAPAGDPPEPAAAEASPSNEPPAPELVSLEIRLRAPATDGVEVHVIADELRLSCRLTQKSPKHRRCLTTRFATPDEEVRLSVEPAREVVSVTLFRWRQPG